MPVDQQFLDIPDFDGLQPGDIPLSAPVINGVVQVGWSRSDAEVMPKLPLQVHVEGGEQTDVVRLSRTDGQPIEVEVVGGELGNLAVHRLSAEPMPALIFRRVTEPGGEDRWQVETGADEGVILDNSAARAVAAVVARFVRQKQAQQAPESDNRRAA